jgi:hypothetical protein
VFVLYVRAERREQSFRLDVFWKPALVLAALLSAREQVLQLRDPGVDVAEDSNAPEDSDVLMARKNGGAVEGRVMWMRTHHDGRSGED